MGWSADPCSAMGLSMGSWNGWGWKRPKTSPSGNPLPWGSTACGEVPAPPWCPPGAAGESLLWCLESLFPSFSPPLVCAGLFLSPWCLEGCFSHFSPLLLTAVQHLRYLHRGFWAQLGLAWSSPGLASRRSPASPCHRLGSYSQNSIIPPLIILN